MKKLLIVLVAFVCSFTLFNTVKANSEKLVDDANILSQEERNELETLIDNFIAETNYDIVIYTTEDPGTYFDRYDEDEAITALADDYYDNQGYGIGQNNDGLIIVILFGEDSIGYNTYTITTCGACIDTYNDTALYEMYENITACFADGQWLSGLKEFIEKATYVYEHYDEYHYQDIDDPDVDIFPEQRSALSQALVPALISGLLVSLMSFLILRNQLKNTGVKTNAKDYLNGQKINIARSGEIVLYTSRHANKIERVEPSHTSSHSSSSSSHVSSSGRSHGGGGSHRF